MHTMIKISKNTILSIIAHDLRDPLTSISGISGLLLENWDDFAEEEKLEIVNEIMETSGSTLRLLTDLLEWSKQISKIALPIRKMFDASLVVGEICEPFSRIAKWKNIIIGNHVKTGIQLFADENLFAAVVRNLLANAVKSCPNEGKIEISAEISGQETRFCIADNGIGMATSRLDFFFSEEKHDKKTIATGNGFGLILCKDFAELNGGKIWAESVEGTGTTVCFTVPS